MKRSFFALTLFAIFITEFCPAATIPTSNVRQAFENPGFEAKPWCFWYWMNGCVSREGIVADLDAMQQAGLGGTDIFPIRGVEKPSKFEPAVETMSPEWWNLIRFTLNEAGKRQLQIGMHICDGFALAGGPWITPDRSMQKVVWTQTSVKGGKMLKIRLSQPETLQNYYRDIAVFAYPAQVSTPTQPVRIYDVLTPDTNRLYLNRMDNEISMRAEDTLTLVYEYKKPFLCRSIQTKAAGNQLQCHRFLMEASDDGVRYRFVARLEPPRHGWQNWGANLTHAVPPTTARYFRFRWSKEGTLPGAEDYDNAKWKPTLKLSSLCLSSDPKIHQFEGKSAAAWRVAPATTEQQLPASDCIPFNRLINLTAQVKDGVLTWKAPRGNWIVLRMGHTSTGFTNATGGAGKGLECDKLSPEAVQLQFDRWFGEICRQAGPDMVGKVLKIMHIDSWECGSQNWTEQFPEEFQRRRGYDLRPWLPVFTGLPIESGPKTEQVLYDVRLTISEMVNDIFYRIFVDEAHAKGCLVSAESVAPVMAGDGLSHHSRVDFPMGEFWLKSPTHDKPNDMLDALSGAHIYGKNIIQAEGFTQLRNTWDETPDRIKTVLDRQFALGLNRFVFHVYTHNPFVDRKPGMTLSGLGLFFQRDQTWWKPAQSWVEYITRCQSLLQLGKPVADIAVFSGLELPRRALLPDRLVPSLPGIFGPEKVLSEQKRQANRGVPLREEPVGVIHAASITPDSNWVNALRGYQYDTFNPEVLFDQAKAENGRIVLPGGTSYGALVIPLPHPMAPDSVTPYEKEEARLRKVLAYYRSKNVPVLLPSYLARDLKTKAMIPWNEESFASIGLPCDIEIAENGKDAYANVAYIHRTDSNFDLYFLSNQKYEARHLELSFRITGRRPERYNPLDGSITPVANWEMDGQRTWMKLDMEPGEACFIVFEQPAEKSYGLVNPSFEQTLQVEGLNDDWEVRFDTAFGGPSEPQPFPALVSWTQHQLPGVRNYSGTAVYEGSFLWNNQPACGAKEKISKYLLHLGKVADLAEVVLNGQPCGTAWTAPWTVDVTSALKTGENRLEIRVTNTWANRIEADDKLPVNERITWTDGQYRRKNPQPLPAGLLGPLRLSRIVELLQNPAPETPTAPSKTVSKSARKKYSGKR